MSDTAQKDASSSSGSAMMLRAWQVNAGKPGEKIVSLLPSFENTAGGEAAGAGAPEGGGAPLREWSSAIDLIQEASEAIRIGEQRAAELEAQLNHVVTQASEEMRRLNQQIAAGEQKLARAEERARLAETRAGDAEARAGDAEAWLVRLHDAVFAAFGQRKAQETDSSHADAAG